MKTPDDFVKGLDVIQKKIETFDQLESTVSQVSKALCGKENATLDELLHAADQFKSRLAQAERERDALMHDVSKCRRCETCAKKRIPIHKCPHFDGGTQYPCWQWRGVCPENTKEE